MDGIQEDVLRIALSPPPTKKGLLSVPPQFVRAIRKLTMVDSQGCVTMDSPVSSGRISYAVQGTPLTRNSCRNHILGNGLVPMALRPLLRQSHHRHLEVSSPTVLVPGE